MPADLPLHPPGLSAPQPLPFSVEEARALRDLAVASALRAGDHLRDRFGKDVGVRRKGAIDLVTEADHAAEALAIEVIRATRPADAILAEERGGEGEGARVRWLIDPLDGTTNFAHAFPFFAVSIGAEVDGVLAAGAVHVPMLGEMFAAARGAGATLNGRPIA